MDSKEFLNQTMTLAKKNLSKHGTLLPVSLILSDDGEVSAIPNAFDGDEEKVQVHFKLGILAAVADAVAICTIQDVAMKGFDRDVTDDPTERPLLYPKSMRTEAILLSYLNVRTGETDFCIQCYKDTDGIEYIDTPTFSVMESNLLKYVMNGYQQAKEKIKNGEVTL